SGDRKKKKFTVNTVNGPIRTFEVDSVYYVNSAENEENQRFLANIKSRQLLKLMSVRGHLASRRDCTGSYNSLLRTAIVVIRVTVHKGQDTFWTTLGVALGANYNKNELKDIKSSFAFFNAFARNAWEEQKTVVFVDEFDRLYDATNDVRRQCLETFRKIRNNNHLYEVHSITARGTSSELDKCTLSPFNIAESLTNPYFSAQQTHGTRKLQ
ncbi:hypothetical protein BC936DRAFT_139903, partial [Jimgerdemannia flammicorona]